MTNPSLSSDERERLLDAALEVAARAYAPYSNFKVGAAVLTDNGSIYQGCNVENASYGLTICAERSAIFTAVAQEGANEVSIRAIAVLTADGSPATPCGACRQVVFEFNPEAVVIFRDQAGMTESTATDLLPGAFTLD